ncbi:MAG: hypothetical protein SH850_12900 [Planctomycetaceae bacterium]|nr:hypothetical protein [Planctomycetaceae bacterium]
MPLFAWAPPRWWDWASIAALTAGLTGLCLPVRWRRVSAAAVACGFALQFLADQHRLQPWAWQFFILAVVIALADDRLVFRGWMALVISIYFWSALSKLDAEFAREMVWMIFRQLSDTLIAIRAYGLYSAISDIDLIRSFRPIGYAVGIVEITIAFALATRRFRTSGYWGSVFMHTGLITLLGPWGLGHQPGVLVWNALFMVQNTVLFRGSTISLFDQRSVPEISHGFRDRWRTTTVTGFLAFVLCWPALEPWGRCDAWLGWAVYVPRFHGFKIWVDTAGLERLPESYRQNKENQFNGFFCLGQGKEDREWQLFVGAVSLDELGVPIYPNHRFTVGVALDLQERYGANEMDVDLWTRADRWTLYREDADSFVTRAQLEAYARTFRVNALPESVLRRQAEERTR